MAANSIPQYCGELLLSSRATLLNAVVERTSPNARRLARSTAIFPMPVRLPSNSIGSKHRSCWLRQNKNVNLCGQVMSCLLDTHQTRLSLWNWSTCADGSTMQENFPTV